MTLCNIKNDINYWENLELKPVVDDSLLLWLTSDSGVGNVWTDHSNYQNTSILNGGYNRTPIDNKGLFGNAIRLDGSTGYISTYNNSLFNTMKSGMTISIWIYKLTNTPGTIVNRRYGLVNLDIFWFGYDDTNPSKLVFSPVSACGRWTGGVPTVSHLNKWVNLTITYTGSNIMIHTDNQLLSSNTCTGSIPDETTNLLIGAGDNGTAGGISEFTNAIIGSVLVYNRGLSDSERTHNYTHSPLYYVKKAI